MKELSVLLRGFVDSKYFHNIDIKESFKRLHQQYSFLRKPVGLIRPSSSCEALTLDTYKGDGATISSYRLQIDEDGYITFSDQKGRFPSLCDLFTSLQMAKGIGELPVVSPIVNLDDSIITSRYYHHISGQEVDDLLAKNNKLVILRKSSQFGHITMSWMKNSEFIHTRLPVLAGFYIKYNDEFHEFSDFVIKIRLRIEGSDKEIHQRKISLYEQYFTNKVNIPHGIEL